MKNLTIIGFAIGTVLASCASTSGARRAPDPAAAAASPAPRHDHGDGDHEGMMAGMCPMQVSGTTMAATEVEGGIGLSFTTMTGDVEELRRRVRGMAEMHNQRGGDKHLGAGHEGGGMMMPSATTSAEDLERGARLILQPKDPAQLAALREHVRMKAQRMASGECPMKSLGDEPAAARPGEADHDAHHPGG